MQRETATCAVFISAAAVSFRALRYDLQALGHCVFGWISICVVWCFAGFRGFRVGILASWTESIGFGIWDMSLKLHGFRMFGSTWCVCCFNDA